MMKSARTAPQDGFDHRFPSLDRLNAVLDAAGVRRRVLPVVGMPSTVPELAVMLGVSAMDLLMTTLVEADSDYVAVMAPGLARVSPGQIAEIVEAKHVRVTGARPARAWLSRLTTAQHSGEDVSPLGWWEVPFITGLPTVVDQALLARSFVYAGTGDLHWVVRIAPDALLRVTNALVGDVTGRSPRTAPQT
jgi:prolyl-tRNA editing enzyme YbaK/EbsC (Cys-tRNA(Pro) deacylase)